MIFNSIEFALFFPLVFVLYWLIFHKKQQSRNLFLIAVSYFFYGCWDWRFLSLIIISSAVDFIIGKRLSEENVISKRKWLLAISLLVNLGFLGFFKYCNFFIESFVGAFTIFGVHPTVSTLNIILPVGISFYTFQTLSYTLDVYFKKMDHNHDVLSFFAFVSFFPQLVAGPIERAKHLLPQFQEDKKLDYEKLRQGVLLIASGLFKKVVIADRLAVFVDGVYGNVGDVSGWPAILSIVFFAFQLYFDFSGYSEIAVGTARLLDFNLMDNFRRPYLANSFGDFWKRWHISLSTWFKDYLYIPLGGSRNGKWKTIRNIGIVFLLSGLWHGASWNFVIWGGLNAIFLIVLDPLFFNKQMGGVKRVLASITVFIGWALTLVFFRAQSFSDALAMYSNLTHWHETKLFNYGFSSIELKFVLGLLVVVILVEILQERIQDFYGWFRVKHVALRWSLYLLLVFTFLLFGAYSEGMSDSAFIYFQF